MLGNRTLKRVFTGIFRWRSYRALKNSLLKYERPFDGLSRYLFQSGRYPVTMPIRTPLGVVRPVIYSHHDMLTVSEVFCREDYKCGEQIRTVVDIGSNIGISALYFLTRNREAFAYLFEPQPVNCGKLLKNLEHFMGRYEFYPMAIALWDGEAEMGFEDTGRYGGIGTGHETKIRVPCREVGGVLRGILERRGEIDVLKIDTESLEEKILAAVPRDLLRSIKQVFVEHPYTKNVLSLTHDYVQVGPMARFRRRVQA